MESELTSNSQVVAANLACLRGEQLAVVAGKTVAELMPSTAGHTEEQTAVHKHHTGTAVAVHTAEALAEEAVDTVLAPAGEIGIVGLEHHTAAVADMMELAAASVAVAPFASPV